MKSQMRTVDQLYEYVKTTDPKSALTKTAIRRLVTTGAVRSVRIGAKYLTSLDALEEYLSSAGKAR